MGRIALSPGEILRRLLRKWFRRSADRGAQPPDIAAMPVPERGGRATGGGDGAVTESFAHGGAEAAALGRRLLAAERATAAPARGKGAAEDWRRDLYASNRMLIAELDRVALRVVAAAGPDPSADAAAPEASIVMPVWNRADLIGTAIKSVLAQSFARWELIIVDDGSTDDLAGALRPFLADPRIRLVRQANAGECAARNRGLHLARGEIVAYLDSDNFWYPDFLDAAARVFRADSKLEIAYAGISYEWPNGDVRFYLLPYDRAALLRDNLADMNVVVHRRRAFERFGGFDETLNRALEWDLMLRYTADYPAAQIPVVGARYRIVDRNRISARNPLADNVFRIRRKWWTRPARPPRVLYLADAPERLRAQSVEDEIACMRRFGAAIEAWVPVGAAAVPARGLAVRGGPLADAIGAFKPDVLHCHGFALLGAIRGTPAAADAAVTARARDEDAATDAVAGALALPNVRHVYLPPDAAAGAGARTRFVAPVFDTTLFAPASQKNRRLIACTEADASEGSLRFALDLAKLLPAHRIVVALPAGSRAAEAGPALAAYRTASGSPAELRPDVPRADIAALLNEAGMYLHCPEPAGPARPARWPGPIAEAMATGAYIVASQIPIFARYVNDAGAAYDGAERAAALIRATEAWSDQDWRGARNRSVERAFKYHADELVLRPIFEDWCALARGESAAPVRAAAAD